MTFMDKQEAVTTSYKSITVSVNNSIHLTGDHLIYARKSSADKFDAM